MKTFQELESYEDIIVNDSGYKNTQVVEGYIHISVNGVFEDLSISVEEVTSGVGLPDVYMYFDFSGLNNEEFIDPSNVINFFGDAIEYDEDRECWLIVDDGLVSDLYEQYGENA